MNKNKLYYVMAEKNISVAMMCGHLKLSRSAFYRKVNGISEFTRAEIQEIVDFLELESPMDIFFDKKVS